MSFSKFTTLFVDEPLYRLSKAQHQKKTGNFATYVAQTKPCYVPEEQHAQTTPPKRLNLTFIFRYPTEEGGDSELAAVLVGSLGCHTQPGMAALFASIFGWLLESGEEEWARWFAESCVQGAPAKAPAQMTEESVQRQVSDFSLSF